MHSYPGKLVTFEGPDGAGKSSHIQTVVKMLREEGRSVILTREPGGSPVAEKLRSIILNEPMGPTAELLLFAAARADHMDQVIVPALKRGDIVFCDRFADSSYAYQGAGRGHVAEVLMLEQHVLKGFQPDFTLFFDVTLEESIRRLALRFGNQGDSNRLDREHAEFKTRVYEGYQTRFRQNPHRMHRIDGMQSLENVERDVIAWVRKYLPA